MSRLGRMVAACVPRIAVAAVAGLLMAAAFPPFEESEAAWIALVPLILLARFSPVRTAFGWGWLSGSVFWLITLSWLLKLGVTGAPWGVAVLGWLALSLYCALYTGCFVLGASVLLRGDRVRSTGYRLGLVLVLPLFWVGLEYIRGTFATGFPWNPLGVSQYRNLAVIQIASMGGVYAVSAIVAVMNTAIAMTVLRLAALCRGGMPGGRRGFGYDLMTGLLICAVAWSWGLRTARREILASRSEGTLLRVAAVQPNIPQLKKWPPAFADEIYRALATQTEFAAVGRPDLVVWPETAVPFPVRTDARTRAFVRDLAADSAPILAGTMDGTMDTLYNASLLIDASGEIRGAYRKQHLVPFGEYLPFSHRIRALQRFAPLGFTCTAGTESTVLRAGDPAVPFSVLICFEDAFAYLGRKAVRAGARLLINQTNDAWFNGSAGPVQHLGHAVFRAVENRVPVVRCANSGVTAFIDRVGRVERLRGAGGDYAFRGYAVSAVRAPEARAVLTPYARFGDWPFAIPCAVLAAALSLYGMFAGRRSED